MFHSTIFDSKYIIIIDFLAVIKQLFENYCLKVCTGAPTTGNCIPKPGNRKP